MAVSVSGWSVDLIASTLAQLFPDALFHVTEFERGHVRVVAVRWKVPEGVRQYFADVQPAGCKITYEER